MALRQRQILCQDIGEVPCFERVWLTFSVRMPGLLRAGLEDGVMRLYYGLFHSLSEGSGAWILVLGWVVLYERSLRVNSKFDPR